MTPINTLLFSSLLQSMVNFGISVVIGLPEPDVFLDAVTEFAIYNSIVGAILVVFSYFATILMNIAAFNQVIFKRFPIYNVLIIFLNYS